MSRPVRFCVPLGHYKNLEKQKTLTREGEGGTGWGKKLIGYFLIGQTPVVQPASLAALSTPLTAFAASAFALQVAQVPPAALQAGQAAAFISPAAFVTSAFALQAAQVPPATVHAGQAAFTALAFDASVAVASAGVLDMAYAEMVSAAIDTATTNFFMKPPFVEVNLLYGFLSVKPFCTFHNFLKK